MEVVVLEAVLTGITVAAVLVVVVAVVVVEVHVVLRELVTSFTPTVCFGLLDIN